MLGMNGMGFEVQYFERLFAKYLYTFIGGFPDPNPTYYFYGMRNLLYLIPLAIIIFLLPNSKEIIVYIKKHYERNVIKIGLFYGILFFLSIIGITEVKEFIYFQF